jgi:hypothetical protein
MTGRRRAQRAADAFVFFALQAFDVRVFRSRAAVESPSMRTAVARSIMALQDSPQAAASGRDTAEAFRPRVRKAALNISRSIFCGPRHWSLV